MEAAGLQGHGNTHAARQARAEWAAAQDRQREAANRARAREEREQEEWEAEVAQFGEEEASRRRREEREWRKRQADEELPTSEIEAMELEDQILNPMLTISAALRVNKVLQWSASLGRMTTDAFSIWEFEERLTEEISKRDGLRKGWEVTNRMVFIKANCARATRKQQSIDDFSESEWDKILTILTTEAAQSRIPNLIVKIEITAIAPSKYQLKRSHEVLSLDPIEETTPQPRRRLTTTDKRLDQARIRAEAL